MPLFSQAPICLPDNTLAATVPSLGKEPVWLWGDNRPAATPLDHPMLRVPEGLPEGTPTPLPALPLAPDATLPPLATLSLPAQPLLSPGPVPGLRTGTAEVLSAAAGSQQPR